MPNIISNTSAIQYLYQANFLDLLPHLYHSIIVPKAVARDLEQGRVLGVSLPVLPSLSWIDIVTVQSTTAIPDDEKLGPGEKQVIALGQFQKSAAASSASGGSGLACGFCLI